MRLIFFSAFLCSWISYAQNFQMSNKDDKNKCLFYNFVKSTI